MIDATVSRAWMRDLTGLGRFRLRNSAFGAAPETCASRSGCDTDAISIATAAETHPRAVSSRPRADDPVASTI
jgi:hypothetical protein